MKLSQSGIGTMRINKIDEMYSAQDILLQSGQLVQYGTGIFAYNNVPLLVKRNVENIIQKTLNKYGCIEILLPTLQPKEIWVKSERWDKYIEDGTMLVVNSDKGDFCLAPTAEEAVVEFAREKLKSYKHLPATFYQIGEKYRNEIRTRGYLLRGKAFPMMDAYSFNLNLEDLVKTYDNIKNAYIEIFEKIGIKIIPIVADNGSIGGKKSEEFMMVSKLGEDIILYDETTGKGLNTEILEKDNYEKYLEEEYGIKDLSNFKEIRTMELGHIFQLGTRYSEIMKAKYVNKEGKEEPYNMGCYGIGVSRTVAAIYEESLIRDIQGNPTGISLPLSVAPYLIQIIPKVEDDDKLKQGMQLYNELLKLNIGAIIDDRENVTIGAKIKDCKILGTPYMAVIGDKVEKGMIELENTKTNEKEIIPLEDLIKKLIELDKGQV